MILANWKYNIRYDVNKNVSMNESFTKSNFENRLIFGKVKAYKRSASFMGTVTINIQ